MDLRTLLLQPHILTDGGVISLSNPQPHLITPLLLSKSLQRQIRFNGYGMMAINVLSHSLNLVQLVPHQRWNALAHDCAEGLVGEVIRPLKRYLFVEDKPFQEYEDNVLQSIAVAFGRPIVMDAELDFYDRVLGWAELLFLFPEYGDEYTETLSELKPDLVPILNEARNVKRHVHVMSPTNAATQWNAEMRRELAL